MRDIAVTRETQDSPEEAVPARATAPLAASEMAVHHMPGPEEGTNDSFLPRWASGNLAAVLTSIVAGLSAFASTWFLLSPAVETTDRHILMWLVITNVFVASTLIVLVLARIWNLWSNRRNRLAGSRMHMQMVWLFSIVAVVPAAVAFAFAFSILRTSMNDVFSARIDTYQNTARDIANGLVESIVADMQADMIDTATDIVRNERTNIGFERTPISFRQYLLDVQLKARGWSALYILDGNFRIIARIEAEDGDYGLPEAAIFERLQSLPIYEEDDGTYNLNAFSFTANDTERLDYWRGIMKVPVYDNGYLIAYKPITPVVSERLLGVRAMAADWEQAKRARRRLERVFTAGYIVLGLTILFGAVWAALSAANKIVSPIGRLVSMADRVSAGDFDARVAVEKSDGEIGELARSMNHMTAELQHQRSDLIETNRRYDQRRRFTEAVLSGVSAGVLGVSTDGRVAIANRSAAELLGLSAPKMIGDALVNIVPEISALFEEAKTARESEVGGQLVFSRDGRDSTFNVRIVRDRAGEDNSFVVTIDDITQLISAQRNAAWGDVARRIAHEIKNPLTPIQLSAERLRRKYMNEITSNPEVFDRCTDTIIRQVSDIGRMVDEFSSFARMPKPVINDEDLRDLVRTTLFPQRVTFPDIQFVAATPDTPIISSCDGRLIGQAVTNLIKNAAESVSARLADEEGDNPIAGQVRVELVEKDGFAEIRVIDNGIGLPKLERHRLVEPYMTTREKGTGLGLAIVKKIAEDHGGDLRFSDSTRLGPRGACLTLYLPLTVGANSEKQVEVEAVPAAE